MGRILVEAQRAQRSCARVHGQAALLLAAKDEQGKWLFAGRKMTAFSDEEEVELGTATTPLGCSRTRCGSPVLATRRARTGRPMSSRTAIC